jgi:spore protease
MVREHILVTRHLTEALPEHFGDFRPVSSLAAEVLGNTGMESGELAAAVCRRLAPDFVIAVDALASRSLDRLCRTVQFTDTGIVPGSGVGNHRQGLSQTTLGVPVLAVGVPTVVDGATLTADLLGREDCPEEGRALLVTPKDIDRQVRDLSRVIGFGVDLALQPGLTLEELELLLG